MQALWKDGLLRRLELQPLSRNESGQLLTAVLDDPVDSGCADQLWARRLIVAPPASEGVYAPAPWPKGAVTRQVPHSRPPRCRHRSPELSELMQGFGDLEAD